MTLRYLSAALILFAVSAHAEETVRLLDTKEGKVISETGKIEADTSYFGLQKKKMEKLWDGAIDYQEGNCRLATVAYRGTPSEIEVFWKNDPEVTCFQKLDMDWSKLKAPEYVRIRRADSPWKTDTGIGVGTSLEELEKISGGSVGFMGFAWDMGGACCRGTFSNHIGFTLAADESVIHEKSKAAEYYNKNLVGDVRVESKDIPADIKKALNIRVQEIYLNF